MYFGILLIVLGVVGYAATSGVSVTALIPAFFGIVLVGLGLLARNERYRKHAMHVAIVVGLLGLLGTARGLIALPRVMSQADADRPAAVVAQAVMAILMIVYVALGVRSFIAARRARTAK
jgi:hypothetical protein